jgi:outer membrane lipoprotein LolB
MPGIWALTLIVALLSSCASFDPNPATRGGDEPDEQEIFDLWNTREHQLSTINSWTLRGKMGVKTGSKGGSATLKWRYTRDTQDIELYGPFGGGRVLITVDRSGAELRDTKGRVIHGKTASEVLYTRLGWQVPFDYLSDWARGLPGEGASDLKWDNKGRLVHLIKDNWKVEYLDYRAVTSPVEGLTLPAKLIVSALPGTMEIYSDKGEYLGDELNVKVILKRWWGIEIED